MPDARDNPKYRLELERMKRRQQQQQQEWSTMATGKTPPKPPQGVVKKSKVKRPGPVPVKRKGGGVIGKIFGSKSNGKGFGR